MGLGVMATRDHHMIAAPLASRQVPCSSLDVRQDLFGLTAAAPSPVVFLHGYARTNVESISCSRPEGVLDL